MDNAMNSATEFFNELKSFAYSRHFVFLEGIKVMKRETLVSMATAAVAVFAICYFLLASFLGSILVF